MRQADHQQNNYSYAKTEASVNKSAMGRHLEREIIRSIYFSPYNHNYKCSIITTVTQSNVKNNGEIFPCKDIPASMQ